MKAQLPPKVRQMKFSSISQTRSLRMHRRMRTCVPRLALALIVASICAFPGWARAQSPELSMREFSSGQIKKGVRSIGFGGDGATWGNYALVWRDADTGLVDYGDTHYTNGNDFHFAAVGVTSPLLWHNLAIYVIAMFQETNDVRFSLKSPGLGPGPISVIGKGSNNAIFSKIAMPLGKGFSVGGLLSGETSHFDATAAANAQQSVRFQTEWRPSGGFGVAWQPRKTMLFGFRGLLNYDLEHRIDPSGGTQGIAHTAEYRLGGSISPWKGAWVDLGGTRRGSSNALAARHTLFYHPNLGFEQTLLDTRLALRFGLDETSPTAGLSLKFAHRYKLDAAYVGNMAKSRVGNLFGDTSRSFLVTFTIDYAAKHPPSTPPKKSIATTFLRTLEAL
jgi:hypothetical protein